GKIGKEVCGTHAVAGKEVCGTRAVAGKEVRGTRAVAGKELLPVLFSEGGSARKLVEAKGLLQVRQGAAAGERMRGAAVEIKNMNSFREMQRAIDFEITRQSQLLRDGKAQHIVQETRLWDEGRQ
ncbi:unnamed protein product, partial [Closterium sp. NIES-53]